VTQQMTGPGLSVQHLAFGRNTKSLFGTFVGFLFRHSTTTNIHTIIIGPDSVRIAFPPQGHLLLILNSHQLRWRKCAKKESYRNTQVVR